MRPNSRVLCASVDYCNLDAGSSGGPRVSAERSSLSGLELISKKQPLLLRTSRAGDNPA
jgi:hypothetical protein